MKTLTATLLLATLSLLPIPEKASQPPTQAVQDADACSPPQIVALFLGFSPAQVTQYETLLSQFLPTVQGLQQQIALQQAQLDALLSQPSPNPPAIVTTVLQIHALQQQLAQAVQAYQTQFAALLTDEQKQKVQAVTLASQLQPVVGAFVALKVVPPPTPLPCQQ